MEGSLRRLIKSDDFAPGAVNSAALGSVRASIITYGTIPTMSARIGSVTGAKVLYGTLGSAKVSGARIIYGTIPTVSARIGSVAATKVNYGTLTVKQNLLMQDGTCGLVAGSKYVSFPVAYSVAPRAVNLVPGLGAGGTVNARVCRIVAGSFVARCIQGTKTFYFSVKGSR